MRYIVAGIFVTLVALAPCAQVVHCQAASVSPQTAGEQSVELAEASRLESLASVSLSKRNFKEAEGFLQRSLALREKVLGSDAPDVAAVLHTLANVYHKTGQFDKADQAYLRSLSISESKLGITNPASIQVLEDYACSNIRRPVSSQTKIDENGRKLMTRADCLFAGLKDECFNDSPPTVTVLNGKASRLVPPSYPQNAPHETLYVYVFVAIDEGGKVVSAKAPCVHPAFALAAEAAAREASFKPFVVQGKPVPVIGKLIYRFVAQ